MSMGTDIGKPQRSSATGTTGQGLPGASGGGAPAGDGVPFGGGFAGLRKATAQAESAAAADQKAALDADSTSDMYAGMTTKERKAAERAARRLSGSFEDYPHLLAIKPREGYLFRSDYFEVDGVTACVLGFFHDEAARDDFGAFWGINRIPAGLGEGVSVVVFEQVRRKGEKWVDDHISTSEKLDRLEEGEQDQTGTASTKRKAQKVSSDIAQVTAELQDGASYLSVHNRLLVKATTVEALDEAVERITRLYVDRFGTLKVAAYHGEQRQELTGLFRKNDKKRGKGQHFTSIEFAGSHSLVTNGLNDPLGEYVGSMLGDVNTSAVLFDVNGYDHHVVVADSTVNPVLGRAHVPDMWGSKISQSALLNNGRVVHLVLDGANLDALGPTLSGLTARLDMNSGDINMFELFGKVDDELSIFPAHLAKVVLMAEQAYETTDSDRSIVRGLLKDTLTQFYVDEGMWLRNAKSDRARLRLVDLPHDQVPRLQDIVTYFETRYRAMANSQARDPKVLNGYNVLRLVFKDLLDNNGDLFNTHTNDEIDGVSEARRVLYDFSKLMRRGKGVAMAQLVNTVGFAVENLGLGDTVVIHGTEHVATSVKEYIDTQFERLFARGGRVAYLYNDIEKMLDDSKFNHFDKADWTVLGPMSPATVVRYQKHLAQDIPPDLERLVTTKGDNRAYLRRGVTNVVFRLDLALGVNPARAEQRAKVAAEVAANRAARELADRQARDRAEAARAASVSTGPVRRGIERPTVRPRTRALVSRTGPALDVTADPTDAQPGPRRLMPPR